MRKFSLFSFALAAGLMFTACSDEVSDAGGGGSNTTGGGYVAFTINLPTTSSSNTRAEGDWAGGPNGGYDDGTSDEYAATTGKLFVFNTGDDGKTTLQGTFNLQEFNWNNNNETQITTSSTAVAQVSGITGNNLSALVVLNPKSEIGDSYTTDAISISSDKLKEGGFLMSNAPVSSVAGGTATPTDAKITTLVSFNANKIKDSKIEAQNDPACDIYVERALAKVTLSKAENLDKTGANTNITEFTVKGWTLDYTNTKTYLVRNVDFAIAPWPYVHYTAANTPLTNGYRFIDKDPIDSKATTKYFRTHFGIDPNYYANCEEGDLNVKTGTLADDDLTESGNSLYCLENTFAVPQMKWRNTTRAVVAADLKVNGAEEKTNDFYLINGLTSTIYTKAKVQDYLAGLWNTQLQNVVSYYVSKGGFTNGTTVEFYLPGESSGTETTESDNIIKEAVTGGYVTKVKSVTLVENNGTEYKTKENGTKYAKADVEAAAVTYLNSLLGNSQKIAYYKEGRSYYHIRIKHFGENETPWTTSVANDGSTSYPEQYGQTAENQWLGRYGVLRNTWYQIEVAGYKEIGDPEIPDADTDDWDDETDRFLAVKIHILPWAVRKQSATLQ